MPHICSISQNFLHTTHHKVELFKKIQVYWLNCNQYLQKERERARERERERENRFSYKLTEITVVKKHGWEKKIKYIQQFYFLCVRICSPLPNTQRQHRTSDLRREKRKKKKEKKNCPPLSNIKRRRALSYLECIKRGTSTDQASNWIKRRYTFNSFGHNYCL